MPRHEVSFREIQQFRQWWLWVLLLLVTLPEIVIFSFGMITQLVLGNQWGSKPMSDTGLAIAGLLVVGLSILLLWFFYRVRMVTEVRDDGVGMPPKTEKASGSGMQNMRYRARVIGGTLDIKPGAGGGTLVTCSLPGKQSDGLP